MGIAERFATIMRANINDMLEKGTAPKDAFDRLQSELKDAMGEADQEMATFQEAESRAKAAFDSAKEKIKEQEEKAKRALAAGNQGDARTLLTTKVELEQKVPGLEAAYKTAQANAARMRQMRDEMAAMMKAKQEEIDAVAERYEMQAHADAINAAVDQELEALKKSLKL